MTLLLFLRDFILLGGGSSSLSPIGYFHESSAVRSGLSTIDHAWGVVIHYYKDIVISFLAKWRF